MPKEYVGHLPFHDPLHPYLQRDIFPQIGVAQHRADFRVYRMKGSKVYLYEETHTRAQVVGKFATGQRMRQEFDNLQEVRGYGLAGYPHHVVRPLGANDAINSILVEEYCRGESLCHFVNAAIYERRSQQLFATYALRGSVPAAGAMSFSFGVQLGVTALNTAVGIAAAMVLFRTLRPVTALRAARARPI